MVEPDRWLAITLQHLLAISYPSNDEVQTTRDEEFLSTSGFLFWLISFSSPLLFNNTANPLPSLCIETFFPSSFRALSQRKNLTQ